MRSLAYAIACGVLLAGTSVQAQTIGATGDGSAEIQTGAVYAPMGLGDGKLEINGRGGSAEAKVQITTDHVSFESGVAVSGANSSAVSYSGVDITVTNTSTDDISIESFGSTIIPAGMGFYLQDRVGLATDNNIFTGYGQTTSGLGFGVLFDQVGADVTFASASFDFSVTSGDYTLYQLSGLLELSFDIYGNLVVNNGLGDAALALDGFTTAYDNGYALAFAWDATHIDVPLGLTLEQGQDTFIEYRTSVNAFTDVDCVNDGRTCLVAYSGFGDPIGRGGGVSSFAARGAPSLQAYNPITGIVFDPQDVTVFELNNRGGAVPEPATWMTLILGFGLLGAAFRRRRLQAYS
jgi:hypothetical protein